MKFDENQCRSLFTLANIQILGLWELPNGYWPRCVPTNWKDPDHLHDFLRYAELREASPWFLVQTRVGMIKIGWRKRVIAIDWSNTPIRRVITPDDVTKDETSVHAWDTAKAVEYLKSLSWHIMLSPSMEEIAKAATAEAIDGVVRIANIA